MSRSRRRFKNLMLAWLVFVSALATAAAVASSPEEDKEAAVANINSNQKHLKSKPKKSLEDRKKVVTLLRSMGEERLRKQLEIPIIFNRDTELFQSYLEQRRPPRKAASNENQANDIDIDNSSDDDDDDDEGDRQGVVRVGVAQDRLENHRPDFDEVDNTLFREDYLSKLKKNVGFFKVNQQPLKSVVTPEEQSPALRPGPIDQPQEQQPLSFRDPIRDVDQGFETDATGNPDRQETSRSGFVGQPHLQTSAVLETESPDPLQHRQEDQKGSIPDGRIPTDTLVLASSVLPPQNGGPPLRRPTVAAGVGRDRHHPTPPDIRVQAHPATTGEEPDLGTGPINLPQQQQPLSFRDPPRAVDLRFLLDSTGNQDRQKTSSNGFVSQPHLQAPVVLEAESPDPLQHHQEDQKGAIPNGQIPTDTLVLASSVSPPQDGGPPNQRPPVAAGGQTSPPVVVSALTASSSLFREDVVPSSRARLVQKSSSQAVDSGGETGLLGPTWTTSSEEVRTSIAKGTVPQAPYQQPGQAGPAAPAAEPQRPAVVYSGYYVPSQPSGATAPSTLAAASSPSSSRPAVVGQPLRTPHQVQQQGAIGRNPERPLASPIDGPEPPPRDQYGSPYFDDGRCGPQGYNHHHYHYRLGSYNNNKWGVTDTTPHPLIFGFKPIQPHQVKSLPTPPPLQVYYAEGNPIRAEGNSIRTVYQQALPNYRPQVIDLQAQQHLHWQGAHHSNPIRFPPDRFRRHRPYIQLRKKRLPFP